MKKIILLILLSLSLQLTIAQEILISSFDTGIEDWSVSGGGLYYHNSSGNPGGFIEFEDLEDGAGYLVAPNMFLGDLSPYTLGTIRFDLINTIDNGQNMLSMYGLMRISSLDNYVELNVVPNELIPDWTTFTIPLNANSWGVSETAWDSILNDVTEIRIILDAQWNYNDRVGLDNFSIEPYGLGITEDPYGNPLSNQTLSQNYPNPFNLVTTIKYTIPSATFSKAFSELPVILKVYNYLGIEIAPLVNEQKSAGEYEVEFNAKGLTSGIYFYTLQVRDFIKTQKMLLIK